MTAPVFAAVARDVRGMGGMGVVTAMRAVRVVGRRRTRFRRSGFQGSFRFFFFHGFFSFDFSFERPLFPFFGLLLGFAPFPGFPCSHLRFLPHFPFGFLSARGCDRRFGLRAAPTSADCGCHRDAQRNEKRPL